MTGPEHYREAERLVQLGIKQWETGQCNLATDITMPQAQVSATLALAAATMDLVGATVNGVASPGWSEAIA